MSSHSEQRRLAQRIEQIASLTALALVLLGCFVILRPFLSALLWAGILCFSTWPVYLRLERLYRGRRSLAAGSMVTLVAAVMVLPFVLAGISLTENLSRLVAIVNEVAREGLPQAPPWLDRIPLVGENLREQWQAWAARPEELVGLLKGGMARSQAWLLARGATLTKGVFQLSLSVLISFFLYRDGEAVFRKVSEAVTRLAGDRTQYLLGVTSRTVRGVVYGVLGTALAQGILAAVGFWIAGVPSAFLLALLVFALSIVPFGPPLVWVPAAIWLYRTEGLGWALFMVVYGTVAVSGIDNLVRPYLISRETQQPFVLMLLGVMGGVLAFGFIGFFVGPTLLAVGYRLASDWTAGRSRVAAAGVSPPAPEATPAGAPPTP